MRTMLPHLAWTFALLSISLASPVSVDPQNINWDYYCGRDTYGLPNIEDCHPLLESFADYRDHLQRAFDEEQMRVDRTGSWPGVGAVVGASLLDRVVQVPRYYTLSMADGNFIVGESMESCADISWPLDSCNFAIMSYFSGFGGMKALGGTSWAQVNSGGNFMMTRCLLNKPLASGGVIVIPSSKTFQYHSERSTNPVD